MSEATASGSVMPSADSNVKRGLNRIADAFETIGLGWVSPFFRIAAGESLSVQLAELRHRLFIPVLGLAVFLGLWACTQ